ncbi:MAG: hypothetical protein RQ826_15870 [Xanthomonadales bacterium]|nr:hypothetical protein [Xanthomonadales bacterium]
MKRKTLTTAVLAGLTGVAGMVGVSNAVNLNPDGLGQVLLYPYYTARGGNDTLISVVNTTSDAKAVKIRFVEALNSQEVLDFNIYLSAFDVWSAAITGNDDGGASLLVTDTTCTVPYFYGASSPEAAVVDFLPFQFQGDGGVQDIERTASGHFEIIEMGTLVDGNGVDLGRNSATAATHVDGVPAGCQQLVDAWTSFPAGTGGGEDGADSYWVAGDGDDNADDGNTVDLLSPSGGIFGGASIINVADGVMFSYNATAIDGFSDSVSHTNPGSLLPNLNGGRQVSNVFANGAVQTDTWMTGIEAVSATILFDTVMNEYVVNPNIGARSEWVLTFPTKRAYVDPASAVFASADVPQAPFTVAWNEVVDAEAGTTTGTACEPVGFSFWNREETVPGEGPAPAPGVPIVSPPPPEVTPPPPDTFSLCFESNVLRFSGSEDIPETTEILKETRFTTFPVADQGFVSGWTRFEFNTTDTTVPVHATRVTAEGNQFFGLPVIGFWVNTFSNGQLEGANVLSNYGGTFQHRGSRRVEPAAP